MKIVLLILTLSASLCSIDPKGKMASFVREMLDKVPEMEKKIQNAKERKVSKLKPGVTAILGQGYSKFYQSTEVTLYEGVDRESLEDFFDYIGDIVNMPDKYKEGHWRKLAKTMKSPEFTGDNVYSTIFDEAKNNNYCKYIDILVEQIQDDENSSYNILFSEVQASFELSRDVFVTKETKKIAFGIYKETKTTAEILNREFSYDDFDLLITFFYVSSIKRQSDVLEIA